MNRLYEDYHDAVQFFVVYIREAHPADGRIMPANERAGISVKDPTSMAERRAVAGRTCEELKLSWPCLVDGMDNGVNRAYAAWPTRLYVIDREGRIAVAGEPGPRGLAPSIKQAQRWLAENADAGEPVKSDKTAP